MTNFQILEHKINNYKAQTLNTKVNLYQEKYK